MSEIQSQLSRPTLVLNQLSAVASALELAVGELILLAGLLEDELAAMARVTVDGDFKSMSLTTHAPRGGAPLHAELSRRGADFACASPTAPSWLELTATPTNLHARVWRFEPLRELDSVVGHRESIHGQCPLRLVDGGDYESSGLLPLIDEVGVAPTERQLLADIHPLLARGQKTMVVCDASRSQLSIRYRNIATSDALRVLASLNGTRNAGDMLGRLCGTAGARQIDVLELELSGNARPSLRFGVDLSTDTAES